MKKVFEEARVNLIRLAATDILTTSTQDAGGSNNEQNPDTND